MLGVDVLGGALGTLVGLGSCTGWARWCAGPGHRIPPGLVVQRHAVGGQVLGVVWYTSVEHFCLVILPGLGTEVRF